LARTLQKGLLPVSIPRIPGVQLAPRYRPLGTGSDVGGDFYDAFPLGPSEWGVVIGDVAGKGPEAAVLTGIIRHTIRTLAPRVRGPGRMLAALNDRLVSEETVDRFVTICFVTVRPRPEGLEVAIATGGHPPPMMCRIDGSVERVGGHGSVLGLLPDPIITEVPIHVGLGDALVLYSDGLTDAIDRAALPERVLDDLLQGCAGLDAEAIADRLDGAARPTSGTRQRDDVCLVVVQSTSAVDGLRPETRAVAAG
jgi:sigma-B regulation protein RsbU (phosphoserine phosphatase)